MKIVIISGRSGSGKSTALNVLEDLGFYCIDNLPVGLLLELSKQASVENNDRLQNVAVSIDARNLQSGIESFPTFYKLCKQQNIQIEVIYLDASEEKLLQRFHATRRKHPLSDNQRSLKEAIQKERELLSPVSDQADLLVDTSQLTLYELRDLIKERIVGKKTQEIALLFQSFGFKHGTPNDADYVFDVRCLPNPYWDPKLRSFTGLEEPVQAFLASQDATLKMEGDITKFLENWLPHFEQSNRSYLTIAIGCTGGHHRSVYLCEQIGSYFSKRYKNVQIRHKELPANSKT